MIVQLLASTTFFSTCTRVYISSSHSKMLLKVLVSATFLLLVQDASSVSSSQVNVTGRREILTPCSEGWFSFGNFCYSSGVNNGRKLKWEMAVSRCEAEGGQLATIDSQELNGFVRTLSRSNLWIGLHDRVIESAYQWMDGTEVKYTSWDPQEPTGSNNEKEDCVEMLFQSFKPGGKSGNWNDVDCNLERDFICQKKKNTSVLARNIYQEITATDLKEALSLTQSWIIKGRNADRKIRKWGLDLPRKAVALYLSYKSTDSNNTYMDEIAYELTTNFLFKIALKKNDIPTSDIASYVNAFLVACIDPRQFYVLDLVKELRKRVDNMNGTNPFALLAMCNAQEHITGRDVQKLEEEFWIAQKKQRIDTMAMIVLALSCASNQQENFIDQEDLSNIVLELKKRQYRNGTVENVKTTALVMQALFATDREPDEENFDEQKAIQQILRSQEADGSFGSLSNTYYALPVLSGLSLINITTEHCPSFIRDETEMIQNLKDQVGKKLSVKYSFWVGDDKFIQRTLTLSVPINTSFYQVMEYASGLDVKYRFEYNVRNRKPFLYSMYRFMDDPEKEMFWSLNQLTNETSGELKKIPKSPADIYPENNDHLVYWYKTEE